MRVALALVLCLALPVAGRWQVSFFAPPTYAGNGNVFEAPRDFSTPDFERDLWIERTARELGIGITQTNGANKNAPGHLPDERVERGTTHSRDNSEMRRTSSRDVLR